MTVRVCVYGSVEGALQDGALMALCGRGPLCGPPSE